MTLSFYNSEFIFKFLNPIVLSFALYVYSHCYFSSDDAFSRKPKRRSNNSISLKNHLLQFECPSNSPRK